MKHPEIKVGDVLEYFTVLEEVAPRHYRGHNHKRWRCLCKCGTERIVEDRHLKNPHNTTSCGCYRRSLAVEIGRASITHGESYTTAHTAEYQVWSRMWRRIRNPKDRRYSRYGGRGIQVCDRWLSYENFLADMGRRPSSDHQIERKDNDGDYEPDNCFWATRIQQARNKSNNRLITHQKVTRCLAEWAELLGIKAGTLRARLEAGRSVQEAFTTPVKQN